MPFRKFRATTVVVAVLLLAAGCSGGSDAGRGTVPTATTAPAAATTVTISTTSTVTADGTATPTAAPVTTAAAGVAPTVTGTTTADTDTTGTTGTTSGPTGTTSTPTTGSGPTVPTTLPTTDDTTTPTTAATDDTDTESRNAVDEQYPLGSDARKAYLAASGGVAPVGATVTLDLGGKSVSSQHGRTSEDRWPDGYPAAPGSPDYSTTTFAQREAQRAARWVAALDRGGIDEYWVLHVPSDAADPFILPYSGEPVPDALNELRLYTREPFGQPQREGRPPAGLTWAFPRANICGDLAHSQRSDHAPMGVHTIPCELLLDWTLWMLEQFVDPQLAAQPIYDQVWTVGYRKAAHVATSALEPPTTRLGMGRFFNREYVRMYLPLTWIVEYFAGWQQALYSGNSEPWDAVSDAPLAGGWAWADQLDAGRQAEGTAQ